jgi:hypothetical protein
MNENVRHSLPETDDNQLRSAAATHTSTHNVTTKRAMDFILKHSRAVEPVKVRRPMRHESEAMRAKERRSGTLRDLNFKPQKTARMLQ